MTGTRESSRSVGVLSTIRDALTAIGPSRKLLVVLFGLSLVTGLLETTLLYLVGRLALAVSTSDAQAAIDVGPIQAEPSLQTLTWVAAGVVACLVVLAYPTAAVASRLSARTLNRARDRLLGAYLSADWARRSQEREGHLQELVGQYTIRTERVVTQMATLVVVGLSIVMLALGAVIVSPAATLIGVAGFAGLSVLTRPAARRVKRWSSRTALVNRELASQVAQTARLAQEVVAFDIGEEVGAVLRTSTRKASRAVARTRLISRLTPNLYLYGAFALVIAILGVLIHLDTSDLASLGPLMLLFIRGLGYGKQLQAATQTSLEYSPYIQALETEITDLLAAPVAPGRRDVEELGPITFHDVSFAYTPGVTVLSGVTFTIEPGTVLGVVGPSGGGKSTLTQLLLRLRQPTAGRITVGDADLADITPRSWARRVALVPQDNKLIRASVADNIRFFRSDLPTEMVEAAARAAHLHDEIAALPEGYATLIGPGERALSGGQCQRLGIARALLGQPDMLVLDEPTSALDSRSEHLIRDTLLALRHRTTIVIVAHRPATLEICDEILRIEHGRAARPTAPPTVDGSGVGSPLRPAPGTLT